MSDYSDDSVFPTTLDSIAGIGEGAANVQTTLSSAISSSPASIPLTSAASWPTTGSFALIEEGNNWVVYKYSGISGSSLSSPTHHAGTEGNFSTSATVKCVLSSGLINKIVDAIVNLETKVGVDSSAVTTSHDYKLTQKPTLINRQDNTSNSAVLNQRIQAGWGFMPGDDSVDITETVTFPVVFDVLPIVILTPLGRNTSSDPDSIDDFNTGMNFVPVYTADLITTSSFRIYGLTEVGLTFVSGIRYGYSWLAIGPKA